MSRIRAKDTKPEIAVRRLLHGMGFRFRLHASRLPGCPDIVLPRWKTVVLVHGCFWHRHKNCEFAYTPKTRVGFWIPKLSANAERDKRNLKLLKSSGWRPLVVWECETRCPAQLARRLNRAIHAKSL